MSREVHAGFCEKLRVRFPRLTHLDFKTRMREITKVAVTIMLNRERTILVVEQFI